MKIHQILSMLLYSFLLQFLISSSNSIQLVLAETTSSSSTSTGGKNTNCFSYGCPILPLDVINDREVYNALADLAEYFSDTEAEDEDDDDEDEEATVQAALDVLSSAGDVDKCILTLCGYKGGPIDDQINQDRGVIYSPYNIVDGTPTGGTASVSQLLAVFDGHGGYGELSSQHATEDVPKILAQKLRTIFHDSNNNGNEEQMVINALKETFVQVDKTDPSNSQGGSTGTVILQLGSKIYVANVGDSRSFLSAFVNDEAHVLYTTREDKPDIPEEKERITKAGGYVLVPSSNDGDVPRAYAVDSNGRLGAGLAMSRSLGDWPNQGVIAEPIVDVFAISNLINWAKDIYYETCTPMEAENDKEEEEVNDKTKKDSKCKPFDTTMVHILAVSASDGLMDYLTPDYISNTLSTSYFANSSNNDDEDENGTTTPHPLVATDHLILESATQWNNEFAGEYRDDIVIGSMKINLSTIESIVRQEQEQQQESEDEETLEEL